MPIITGKLIRTEPAPAHKDPAEWMIENLPEED